MSCAGSKPIEPVYPLTKGLSPRVGTGFPGEFEHFAAYAGSAAMLWRGMNLTEAAC
jgi:hypothetical protein